MLSDVSPVSGIFFSFLRANGIRHRVASNVRHLVPRNQGDAMRSSDSNHNRRPLVLFLHGFPESWYSWRHQLAWIRDQPVLAVAPDMRGYGSTDQPHNSTRDTYVDEAYTQPELAHDVVALAQTLGYDQFVVVGHDWGAQLAWSVALLYPHKVLGVCGMSVPYAGTPQRGLLTMLQDTYGPCLDPSLPRTVREQARFHYMLHHCLPRCEEEYDQNREEFLYRVYAYSKGCPVQEGTPEHDIHGLMFPPTGDADYDQRRPLDATSAPGWWTRIPRPLSLPAWLTQTDLDYYADEFQKAGFYGGLAWYRAADRNFEIMKELLALENGGHGDKILPPAFFLTGEHDMVIKLYRGKEQVVDRIKANVKALTREPLFIPDCGHWVQQEKPHHVNDALQRFLEDVLPTSNNKSGTTRHSKL